MGPRQRPTVVVAAAVAQRPGIPGHALAIAHYLAGFARLGYDVVFADRLDTGQCTDAAGAPCPLEASRGAAWLRDVLAFAGEQIRWSLRSGTQSAGMTDHELGEALRHSVLLLDVMGYLEPEWRALAARPVFLDIDPGFGQMWQAEGLATMYGHHAAYVTVGTNVGAPDCHVPTLGLDWIRTVPPVVLAWWPEVDAPPGAPFTSIASWRGPFAPVVHQGNSYGLRVHEFRAFRDLPNTSGVPFHLALAIDDEDRADAAALRECGWELSEPSHIVRDVPAYRAFVQRSQGEILIAKNMYVQARTGWISDRSPCYLASGHPVLMQDTGLDREFAERASLLLFNTPDEAAALAATVQRDPTPFRMRARAAATQVFDSDLVLSTLLSRIGITA